MQRCRLALANVNNSGYSIPGKLTFIRLKTFHNVLTWDCHLKRVQFIIGHGYGPVPFSVIQPFRWANKHNIMALVQLISKRNGVIITEFNYTSLPGWQSYSMKCDHVGGVAAEVELNPINATGCLTVTIQNLCSFHVHSCSINTWMDHA